MFAALLAGLSSAYVHEYDRELFFACRSKDQTLSRINSTHSNRKEDRVFQLECKDIDIETGPLDTTFCSWAGRLTFVTVVYTIINVRVLIVIYYFLVHINMCPLRVVCH